ncbi:nitroreductase family deazaflavin-dependent oxidoreductase [Georgenia sp. SUBG003]|uniref:nitroreductase family deazaflavin-dependent oxidoreductase n=1 Tax=Georgenia sp. SUBG003 TaxID=1497974 RepID=UPI0004D382A7|nr:nitroreductase [Georgenia sp. SUBG003]
MSPIPRAVARANRRVLNPVMRLIAPHLPGFGLLTHVGRRSGRRYTIPVNVFRDGEQGFRVALTYGRDAEWVRNVRAAGRCTLQTRGRVVELVEPRLVHDPWRSWAPVPVRQILGLIRAPDVLVMRKR